MSKKRIEAVTYPAASVGTEKDRDKRQRDAIPRSPIRHSGQVARCRSEGRRPRADAPRLRSGARGYRRDHQPVRQRPDCAETGRRMLKAQGVEIIAGDNPGAFVEDTPRSRTALRRRKSLASGNGRGCRRRDRALSEIKLSFEYGDCQHRSAQRWCEGRRADGGSG
jgi:hypothetical protein